MDPLEKERLRKTMAVRMGTFSDPTHPVVCVSSHFYHDEYGCDLCQRTHAHEILVIKNRAGKLLHVSLDCLKEMIRFRVIDVVDIAKWIEKLRVLKTDAEQRRLEAEEQRSNERKKLEKKVIVRRRSSSGVAS